MTLRARNLIGSRVGRRGRVTEIAVAPAPFAVLAFSVRLHWWRPVAWHRLAAVARALPGAIELRATPEFCPPAERAGTITLLGVPVRTVGGVSLGRVEDFLFTTPAGEILEILATSRTVGEVAIVRSAIVSVAEDLVAVRDAAVPAGAAVALGNP